MALGLIPTALKIGAAFLATPVGGAAATIAGAVGTAAAVNAATKAGYVDDIADFGLNLMGIPSRGAAPSSAGPTGPIIAGTSAFEAPADGAAPAHETVEEGLNVGCAPCALKAKAAAAAANVGFAEESKAIGNIVSGLVEMHEMLGLEIGASDVPPQPGNFTDWDTYKKALTKWEGKHSRTLAYHRGKVKEQKKSKSAAKKAKKLAKEKRATAIRALHAQRDKFQGKIDALQSQLNDNAAAKSEAEKQDILKQIQDLKNGQTAATQTANAIAANPESPAAQRMIQQIDQQPQALPQYFTQMGQQAQQAMAYPVYIPQGGGYSQNGSPFSPSSNITVNTQSPQQPSMVPAPLVMTATGLDDFDGDAGAGAFQGGDNTSGDILTNEMMTNGVADVDSDGDSDESIVSGAESDSEGDDYVPSVGGASDEDEDEDCEPCNNPAAFDV